MVIPTQARQCESKQGGKTRLEEFGKGGLVSPEHPGREESIFAHHSVRQAKRGESFAVLSRLLRELGVILSGTHHRGKARSRGGQGPIGGKKRDSALHELRLQRADLHLESPGPPVAGDVSPIQAERGRAALAVERQEERVIADVNDRPVSLSLRLGPSHVDIVHSSPRLTRGEVVRYRP